MNARGRYHLAVFAVLLLSACVSEIHKPGDTDGTGGTGIIADNTTDGIGGTGKADPGDDDGVGGTGLWGSAGAGTGEVAVFGVVTSTDPLMINGYGMLVDEQTVVSLNGQAADKNALQAGSVAWVKAGIRSESIFANEIALQSSVGGPVSDYDRVTGSLHILGQDVRISPRTKITSASSKQISETAIQPGSWLEVSGLRRDGQTIEATLVTFKQNENIAFVRGFVNEKPPTVFRLGNLLLADGPNVGARTNGTQLFVTGILQPHSEGQNKFQVMTEQIMPALAFSNEVSYYSVQGYLAPGSANNQSIGFAGLARQLRITPEISERVNSISINGPVILDLKQGLTEDYLEVLRINMPNQSAPQPMLIPEYSPQAPSGEFTGTGGMRRGVEDPASAILIRQQTGAAIDKTAVLPSNIPSTPAVGPGLRVDTPTAPPQIRAVPIQDIVRPQLPDARTPRVDRVPGSVGPR